MIGWLPPVSVFCLVLALISEVGWPFLVPHAGAWFVGGVLAFVLSGKVRS